MAKVSEKPVAWKILAEPVLRATGVALLARPSYDRKGKLGTDRGSGRAIGLLWLRSLILGLTLATRSMILVLGTTAAAEAQPSGENELRELAWLAGCWSGRQAETEVMECWSAPRGGLMLGWNRTVRDGKSTSFEFLRIAATADGVVYFASPGGREATPFKLVEVSDESALFENPEHDFPQRIRYRLGYRALQVRVEATADGESRHLEWTWQAAEFPGR